MYSSNELRELINSKLSAFSYHHQPQGLYDPINYVLSIGGKRIRPILLLMAYNLYHEEVEPAITPAIALETYHNYTLLHDDLMDCADMRRGKPTVHKKWNDNTAILSGDSMLVLAYQKMQQCGDKYLRRVLELFTKTALEIGEGQQFDMEFETRMDVREEEYIEMIRLKTSVLLACALKIGAILADAPEEDADNLYKFGESIGLAFQLQDDFLDVYGDSSVFGKKIGGDILCNKKTYMLIQAWNLTNEQQRKELEHWLTVKTFKPEEKIKAVTEIYNEVGIDELCKKKIEHYFSKGEEFLKKVAVNEEKKAMLRAFSNSLLKRRS